MIQKRIDEIEEDILDGVSLLEDYQRMRYERLALLSVLDMIKRIEGRRDIDDE
jgi:hypothetical protein